MKEIYRILVLHPKHAQNSFHGAAVTFGERVVKAGRGFDGSELPEVAALEHVEASPRSLRPVGAQCPRVLVADVLAAGMFYLCFGLHAGSAGFIDEQPPERFELEKHLAHVFLWAPFFRVGRGAVLLPEHYLAPGVQSEATNQSAHGVLGSQKDKLDAVLPCANLEEKILDPQQELGFSSAWNAMQQATQGLASSNFLPLLFCMFFFASLHDAPQSTELFCRGHDLDNFGVLRQRTQVLQPCVGLLNTVAIVKKFYPFCLGRWAFDLVFLLVRSLGLYGHEAILFQRRVRGARDGG